MSFQVTLGCAEEELPTETKPGLVLAFNPDSISDWKGNSIVSVIAASHRKLIKHLMRPNKIS